jgi:lysophospholipase L1-like esterase
MIKQFLGGALIGALAAGAATATAAPRIERVDTPRALTAFTTHVNGRTWIDNQGLHYQWPGVYFETAFEGDSAFITLGPGKVILHVLVDGARVGTLVQPEPGTYRIADLAPGRHTLRIDVASESQAGPNTFRGIAHAAGSKPAPLAQRSRRIEFIGDSHTVGYGNTSKVRECSDDEVWRTTDNTQAFGPLTARHYGADYRINAISGRGVVRNYNGFAADTLPAAYPYALFDRSAAAPDSGWEPQVVVIALGTNDLSTALNAGERWKTRAELHADYQAGYVKFVQSLRARYPGAHFVLWATDGANGEIQGEVRKVVGQLQAAGERRVSFMPVSGLTLGGCHYHPSVADSQVISRELIKLIDAQPDVWGAR